MSERAALSESEEKCIYILDTQGYLPGSYCPYVRSLFKKYPELRANVFAFNGSLRGHNGNRTTGFAIFGKRNLTCYVLDQPWARANFVKYLENLFHSKNPKATAGMRSIFTKILHQYQLHWSYCVHR